MALAAVTLSLAGHSARLTDINMFRRTAALLSARVTAYISAECQFLLDYMAILRG